MSDEVEEGAYRELCDSSRMCYQHSYEVNYHLSLEENLHRYRKEGSIGSILYIMNPQQSRQRSHWFTRFLPPWGEGA